MAARYGDKSLAVFGLALMVLGDAVAAAVATPDFLFAGRIVSGVGGVVFNVVLTKMVSDWFAGREIVTAMAMTAASSVNPKNGRMSGTASNGKMK